MSAEVKLSTSEQLHAERLGEEEGQKEWSFKHSLLFVCGVGGSLFFLLKRNTKPWKLQNQFDVLWISYLTWKRGALELKANLKKN